MSCIKWMYEVNVTVHGFEDPVIFTDDDSHTPGAGLAALTAIKEGKQIDALIHDGGGLVQRMFVPYHAIIAAAVNAVTSEVECASDDNCNSDDGGGSSDPK